MELCHKILILCICVVSSFDIEAQNNALPKLYHNPLKVEKDALGALYYFIDHNALDLDIIDYSGVYETYLTPIYGQLYEDCTHKLIEGQLQLDSTFFDSYSYWGAQKFAAPANGVLGNDFKRIDVFFYSGASKIDPLSYEVSGRTKVKDYICDFTGEISIKKVYHIFERDIEFPDYYTIIASYKLREDPSQKGSGIFRGIFGAYGYIDDESSDTIKVDNISDGDGYQNRNFVGTWQSYNNPSTLKRCMWGDNRLPFRFDFDIGDGEMVVNPKYFSSEWDCFMRNEDIEVEYQENGDSRAKYKNVWWVQLDRQAKIDSITAELEKQFGWNDAAYAPEIAYGKWKAGEASFLLQGGIAPAVYIGQENFKKKYGVDYDDFGCMTYCSDHQMKGYNTVIMDCLTAKYGNKWIDDVRKDVPGVAEYGKELFKSLTYANDSISTVTIPVVYQGIGKAVETRGKDSAIIDRLPCGKYHSSMEFLYNGISYYMPLCEYLDLDRIVTSNNGQLVEIQIQFYNPKVYKYSKSTIPYPFGVIRQVVTYN